MPKTNHRRGFKDEKDYSTPPGDFTNGKHGAANNRRGAKKFANSRTRFHENSALRAFDPEVEQPIELVHQKDWKIIGNIGMSMSRSKLRRTSNSGESMVCARCLKDASMLMGKSSERMLCKGCYTIEHGKDGKKQEKLKGTP